MTWGSTTSFSGIPGIGLPVAAAARQVGTAYLLDTTTRAYMGIVDISGSTASLGHTESGNSGSVNATNPFTWTTNDGVIATFFYESSS